MLPLLEAGRSCRRWPPSRRSDDYHARDIPVSQTQRDVSKRSLGRSIPFGFAILTWAYLLSAVGFILTRSRGVARTAAHIRRAWRIVEPKGALRTLVVQLGIAAVAFTIFSLRPPPESLVEISRYIGCVSAASIVWAGTMSVGLAGFGAAAHAAFRAL